MEVYKKYNVKGEFYLTSTMWEKYKENYPEIIELLKDNPTSAKKYFKRGFLGGFKGKSPLISIG